MHFDDRNDGPTARFSPLKMVARALAGRPEIGVATEVAPATVAEPAPPVSGDAFLSIVNAMLDDGAPADEAEVGVIDLFDEAQAVFAADAEAKGVALAFAVSPSIPALHGDAPRVRQALMNLVSGSLKATRDDTLTVTADWDGAALALHISGVGPATLMARVVADDAPQGARRQAAARFAQARAAVRALGGAVRVSPGEEITVTLPLRAVAGAAAPVARPAPAATPAFKPLATPAPIVEPKVTAEPARPDFRQGLRVLVAEAAPAHQQMLTALLAGMGLDAVVVGDSQEALTAWRQEGWDTLLIDIESDAIAGRGLARSIRAAETAARWPRMPILALATRTTLRDLDEDFADALDGLVSKPTHAAALEAALGKALNAEPAAPAALAVASVGFRRL